MKRALLFALLCAPSARASETPPVIIGVREAMRDARRVLEDNAPRHAQADAGGECVALVELDDDTAERIEVERHLAECSRAGRRSDPWMVLDIIRIERDLGAPTGLLSSAACWETGYTHGARGDWQHGKARAVGPWQLHAWYSAWCGLSTGGRDDVQAAGRCYLARVEYHAAQAVQCASPWTVGEAMAANAMKYGPWGCAAKSLHAVELEGWR